MYILNYFWLSSGILGGFWSIQYHLYSDCGLQGCSGQLAVVRSSVVEHWQVKPGVPDWIPCDCLPFTFLCFHLMIITSKCPYFWLRQYFVTKTEGLRTREDYNTLVIMNTGQVFSPRQLPMTQSIAGWLSMNNSCNKYIRLHTSLDNQLLVTCLLTIQGCKLQGEYLA